MKLKRLIGCVALALSSASWAAADAPPAVVINPNGGWSWFGDERAVVDSERGVLYVGSLANGSGHGGKAKDGDVEVTRVDLATGDAVVDVLHRGLTSYGGGDDHNVASLLVLPGGRVLAALIGAPGSGKSHMAEALAAAVQALGRPAAVLPMDGFHYDDAVLEARGLRPRKGAPETFDAEGLAHLLDRLRRNDAAEVAVTLFDRTLEISRAGARIIGREVEVVIVEGNWLLLRRPPWAALAARFDLTARLEVGAPVLRARLTERWVGLGLPEAEIRRKLDALDLPNGRLVAEESRETDYVVANG